VRKKNFSMKRNSGDLGPFFQYLFPFDDIDLLDSPLLPPLCRFAPFPLKDGESFPLKDAESWPCGSRDGEPFPLKEEGPPLIEADSRRLCDTTGAGSIC
jgi:hypothetical protein